MLWSGARAASSYGENVAHMVEGVLYEGKPADYEQALADGATLVLARAPEAQASAAE